MTRTPTRGWLGGTFDPIHLGHLDVARAAHDALALDRVTFVPTRLPPHRAQPVAPPDARVAMARLAATEAWMDVSTIEIDSDGPSYTMATLDRLEAAGVDLRTLIVITGADAFADIHSWHRAHDLLDRVSFAVVSRPGHPAPALPDSLPTLAPRMRNPSDRTRPAGPVIVLVDAPTSPVSSTQVRAAAAAGRPLTGLVPDPVASYIEAHGLYRVNTA